MRGFTSTLLLLLVLVGLGAYIYFVDSKSDPAAADAKAKAFTVSPENIEEVAIRNADGVTTRVQRVDANWRVVEPEKADADSAEVASITSSLAGLEVQRVVDENAQDLAQYGLAPAQLEVSFRARNEKEARRLLIGGKTPTGGDLYAQVPGQPRVFLISSYLESTFNRNAFNLRDKDILKFDRDKVDSIAIEDADAALEFRRQGADWLLVRPIMARGDYANVESLLQRLSSAQMATLATAEAGAADVARFGLDAPRIRVNVSGGDTKATLLIGTPDASGAPYAKDAARPPIFTIDQGLLGEFSKDIGEFRRKDLFDFRTFTATRVEVQRAGKTQVFEKAKGSDGKEVWRDAAGKTIDTAKAEDVLGKITALRAQSYLADPHASLQTPLMTVVARFDNGKTETVAFARSGTEVHARRFDEPGSGKLESGTFDDAIKALDGMP